MLKSSPRSDIFISPLEDIYFVTELLGTDLHRLLTSRPLEKQFIQYFLYQILVRCFGRCSCAKLNLNSPQRGLKYVHSAGVVHRDLASLLQVHLSIRVNANLVNGVCRNLQTFSSMRIVI